MCLDTRQLASPALCLFKSLTTFLRNLDWNSRLRMVQRSAYLAEYGRSKSARAHIATFIPNADCDYGALGQDSVRNRAVGLSSM